MRQNKKKNNKKKRWKKKEKEKEKENPEGHVYVFSNAMYAHYGDKMYKIGQGIK